MLAGFGMGGGDVAFTSPEPSVDPEEGSWWWVISEGILHKTASWRDEVTPTEHQPEAKDWGRGQLQPVKADIT